MAFNGLHGVMSQKIQLFITIVVRTPNPIDMKIFAILNTWYDFQIDEHRATYSAIVFTTSTIVIMKTKISRNKTSSHLDPQAEEFCPVLRKISETQYLMCSENKFKNTFLHKYTNPLSWENKYWADRH
jgi:hypothetical protein